MRRLLTTSLLGWGISACSQPGPGPAPSPRAPDAITLRLDAPIGQVSRYREAGNIIPLDAQDMAAPRLYETVYWTRTVTAVSGDTEVATVTFDSSIVAAPPGDHLISSTVSRFHDADVAVRMNARGRVLRVRTPSLTNVPGTLVGIVVGEPFSAGRRPELLLPGRPVIVGDEWMDSIPLRAGPPQAAGPRMARLTYRLTAVGVKSGARRASIAVSGEVPWLAGDSLMVRCGPRRIRENVEFDIDQRRPVRWTYTWTSRCDVGRMVTLGGSVQGYLER